MSAVVLSTDDPAHGAQLARHATDIDPGYADAWQLLAHNAGRAGDLELNRQALDDCLVHAPGAVDCAYQRMLLDLRHGECAAMETRGRAVTTRSPNAVSVRPLLAAALGSRGASRDLVTETLKPFWSSLPVTKSFDPPHQRALIAILYGDFSGALSELDTLARAVDANSDLGTHVKHGLARLELFAETNDAKGAARFADDLARRMPAWVRPPILPPAAWGMRFFEPRVAALRLDLSPPERERDLATWRSWVSKADTEPFALWAYGEASSAESTAAAERALAHMPVRAATTSDLAGIDAFAGRALLRGGRAAEAIAPLRVASARCDATQYPFEQTRAHLWLGQALEATGDTKGACEAYAVVLARWGEARPASVTATSARERSTKLACPK